MKALSPHRPFLGSRFGEVGGRSGEKVEWGREGDPSVTSSPLSPSLPNDTPSTPISVVTPTLGLNQIQKLSGLPDFYSGLPSRLTVGAIPCNLLVL